MHAKFSAKIEQLHPMLEWIRNQLSLHGFDDATVRKIELALEEAFVNITKHAYKQRPGKVEIDVKIQSKTVEITLHDKGPPFNPLEKETSIDRDPLLENWKEGGLGIILMRQYMDEVRYQRKDDSNILTLVKNRKP